MTTQPKTITLSNLQPGASYDVWVRGVTKDGKYSYWSKNHNLNVIGDSLPPSQPEAPTVTALTQPQTVLVRHTGKKQSEDKALESDVVSYQVYITSTSTSAPDPGTGGSLIGVIPAINPFIAYSSTLYSQSTFQVDFPIGSSSKYFYVVAVDSSGNISTASPTASISGTMTYFASAYISDLSADKITTGTLSASTIVTVGTGTNTVVISGTNSSISAGSTAYNTGNGFWLAKDALGAKLSLKGSSTNSLLWDGSSLTVNGAINALSGSIQGNLTFSGSLIGTVPGVGNASATIYSTNPQVTTTSRTGVFNAIGSTYRTVIDANDVQTFNNTGSPAVASLNIQRFGGGLKIGDSGTESDTNLYGDLYIRGSGALAYALRADGPTRITGDTNIGTTVAGTGQRFTVDGSAYIDGNLTVTGTISPSGGVTSGYVDASFSSNTSKTVTINYGAPGDYVIMSLTPENTSGTDFTIKVYNRDTAAGTLTAVVATRGGGTYTGTVRVNWMAV